MLYKYRLIKVMQQYKISSDLRKRKNQEQGAYVHNTINLSHKFTILLYHTILYFIILYYIILYYTILHYTMLYYTILILYYTMRLRTTSFHLNNLTTFYLHDHYVMFYPTYL